MNPLITNSRVFKIIELDINDVNSIENNEYYFNSLEDLLKHKYEKVVLNDKDHFVTDTFKAFQNIKKDDLKYLNFKCSSKDLFDFYKQSEGFSSKPLDILQSNFFRNKYSFGGKNKSYSNIQLNQIKETLINSYDELHSKLKDVKITNDDYLKIIEENNNEDTFLYLDPPYLEVSCDGYKHKTINIDELYNTLKNFKGKFMLSYNPHPKILEKFKEFNIKRIPKRYNINNKIKNEMKEEIIITNY